MEYLKDVDIDFGSILIDNYIPTNGRVAIVKGENGQTIRVSKADVIKGELHRDLMASGHEDSQGDGYTDEAVEKAQSRRLDKIIKSGSNKPSDINHSYKPEESIYLKQSFVFKEIDKAFYKDDKEHTVFREVYGIENNPLLMEKAKVNGINGVSIAGEARIDTEKGILQSIKDGFESIKGLFKSEIKEEIINKGEKDMTKEEIMAMNDEQLKEYGVQKIVAKEPETSEETLVKAEPETVPETISKADFDAYKVESEKKISDLETEMKEIAKGRATGSEEIPPKVDVNKMTADEIKKAIAEDPKGYQALLDEEVAKRLKQ